MAREIYAFPLIRTKLQRPRQLQRHLRADKPEMDPPVALDGSSG
jgi:hypothetical protein